MSTKKTKTKMTTKKVATEDKHPEVAQARALHEQLHTKLYKLMDAAVERGARQIMLEYPAAIEYVQAMGSWFFVVAFTDIDGENLDRNVNDSAQLLWTKDSVDAQTFEMLLKLADAIDAFGTDVMDAYVDVLDGRYTPMRFTARGEIDQNW